MRVTAFLAGATVLFAACWALAAQPEKSATPDWITASNKPCKVWNPEPQADESVTWSGACKDGYATGRGVLRWTENGKPDMVFDGEYANGKRNGHGTIITPDGKRVEGVWVDDKPLVPDSDSI
ncbi:MAG TPA: hypothetical protein VHT51_15000 [Micropepsaceae bacterium]|jgi:hypothetical protein|nr:hypothetical protein [Micropepsaceae bacterium]